MAGQSGAGRTSVRVEGIKELRSSLKAVEDAVDRKALQATLKADFRAAADMVAQAAKSGAPKRTGKLAGTIRPKGALRGATVMAGGVGGVKWAGPIHWGWQTRPNKSKGWRGGPIKANPFLTRALNARKEAIRDHMESTVARLLKQVKGI